MEKIYTERLSSSQLDTAAELLCNGQTVALPTETVYGLGANALDASAIARIFAAKQRPAWDPLIVHVADANMLQQVVSSVPDNAQKLMQRFWPGPLTLLLPRSAAISDAVTAGRALVGVRMPAHPIALELIRLAGVPIAAPSANRFGHVSPTTAQHVLTDLDGRIAAVVDAGPCAVGVESTVFDPATRTLYRPGAITAQQLEEVVGPVTLCQPPATTAQPEALPSPGVGIRHYAPRTRVQIIHSQQEWNAVQGSAVVLLPSGWSAPEHLQQVPWGVWKEPATLAATLYSALRTADTLAADRILIPIPPESPEPLVAALRDRIQKAARPS